MELDMLLTMNDPVFIYDVCKVWVNKCVVANMAR